MLVYPVSAFVAACLLDVRHYPAEAMDKCAEVTSTLSVYGGLEMFGWYFWYHVILLGLGLYYSVVHLNDM